MSVMHRREFVLRTSAAAAAYAFGDPLRLAAQPERDGWRVFEITTLVDVRQPAGRTRVWLPAPLVDTPYQRSLGDTYRAERGVVEMVERPEQALDMFVAEWPDGVAPRLTVVSRLATKDYAADLTKPTVPPPPDLKDLSPFLRATRLIPIDGIVKKTADEITAAAHTDFERARAIYDWIVDNTFRDPNTRGCGTADIRFMLESKNLGGKCADLNALFVGLARASGIPARDVYGLRIAPTRREFKSLGLASSNATRAQHCRAEVYLTGYGWVPIDPADVRKVALEEPPGHLDVGHPLVRAARERLFGAWEMNWIAFNYAHDLALPGAKRRSLPYFMYPQAETDNGAIDSLDPDAFHYEIAVSPVE